MVSQNQPEQDLVSLLRSQARKGGKAVVEQVRQMSGDEKEAVPFRNFDAQNVISALSREADVADLTESEHAVWLECFCELMATAGPDEVAFFAERERDGLGCGLDKRGKLVAAGQSPIL